MSMASARAFSALGQSAGGLGEALMRAYYQQKDLERASQYDQMAQERHSTQMEEVKYNRSRRPLAERREAAADILSGIFGPDAQVPENAGTTVPIPGGGTLAPEWMQESKIARTLANSLPAYAQAHDMDTEAAKPFLEGQLRGAPISYSPLTRKQQQADTEFNAGVSLDNAITLQDDAQQHDIGRTLFERGMGGLESRAAMAIQKYGGDPEEAIRQIQAEHYSRKLRGQPDGLPGAEALIEEIRRMQGQRDRRDFLGIGSSAQFFDLTNPFIGMQ